MAWRSPSIRRPMRLLGHGIDLVDIARIERLLADHGQRFLDRCFTAREAAHAHSGRAQRLRVERLAGRFAVKEAVLKALGTGWRGGIAWTDMEILPDAAGAPRLALSGEALRIAERKGIREWSVSLSHTAGQAVGSAIALGD